MPPVSTTASWRRGSAHGIANAGYRAIDSCRMEKGYLYWSSDITPETNPYEAGLGFCVRLDKGDFIGREALARVKAEGPRRKLVTLTVDGFAPFHGGETIVHDGKVVGSVIERGLRPHSRQDHRLRLRAGGARVGAGVRPRRLRRLRGGRREARGRSTIRRTSGSRDDGAKQGQRENAMNMHDDTITLRQLIDRLALFPGASPDALTIDRLGGQTNRVYRVGDGKDVLCLRLPGKGTEEYINRRVEMVAAEATAKAGVSPEVLHFDAATGVMVTRFIADAVTMSPASFRHARRARRSGRGARSASSTTAARCSTSASSCSR